VQLRRQPYLEPQADRDRRGISKPLRICAGDPDGITMQVFEDDCQLPFNHAAVEVRPRHVVSVERNPDVVVHPATEHEPLLSASRPTSPTHHHVATGPADQIRRSAECRRSLLDLRGVCGQQHDPPIGQLRTSAGSKISSATLGGISGTTTAPNNYDNKDDHIPQHEPFQYYAATANRTTGPCLTRCHPPHVIDDRDGAREEARRWVRRKRVFYTVVGVYLSLSIM
jgi:hypothetical protein